MGTAVVTGANRGIGLEFARQLATKGSVVYATARRPSEARELQQLAAGGKVVVTELDVSSPDSIQRWAADMRSRVQHVDLLVNNAGIASWGGLEAATSEEMMRCFQTNTVGPLLVTQALHALGLLSRGSLVAQMTSKMGSVDDNGSGGCYAYRASKAALNIVNKSLSIDLGKEGVTCVLLHPGFVRTDMVGGGGLISTQQSVDGLRKVLERSGEELQGRWFAYDGREVPW